MQLNFCWSMVLTRTCQILSVMLQCIWQRRRTIQTWLACSWAAARIRLVLACCDALVSFRSNQMFVADSDACEEPLLNKGPQVWLRICQQPRRCLKEAPNVGREDAQDAATTEWRPGSRHKKLPTSWSHMRRPRRSRAGFDAGTHQCLPWFDKHLASLTPNGVACEFPCRHCLGPWCRCRQIAPNFYWELTSILIGYKCVIRIRETHTSASCRKVTSILWTTSPLIFLLLALSVPFQRTVSDTVLGSVGLR